MNLYSLTRRFPTEQDPLDHLVRTRWPKGVRCLACNYGKCWQVESTNKNRRAAAFVSMRFLQVPVQCDDRHSLS